MWCIVGPTPGRDSLCLELPQQKKGKEGDPTYEPHGVMIVYKKELEKFRIHYKQISGREVEVQFKMRGPPPLITNVYAPHSGRPLAERRGFFKGISEKCERNNKGKCHILMGDFNTRFHGRQEGEEDILGPFIFGRGVEYIDQQEQLRPGDFDTNRQLLCEVLRTSEKF